MALSLAKTCTKLGLSGGAVYWSVQQGVWGTTQEGADAMRRFTASIHPEELKVPQPTVLKSTDNLFLSSWNQGAKFVFKSAMDIPESAGKAKTSVTNFVEENLRK